MAPITIVTASKYTGITSAERIDGERESTTRTTADWDAEHLRNGGDMWISELHITTGK